MRVAIATVIGVRPRGLGRLTRPKVSLGRVLTKLSVPTTLRSVSGRRWRPRSRRSVGTVRTETPQGEILAGTVFDFVPILSSVLP